MLSCEGDILKVDCAHFFDLTMIVDEWCVEKGGVQSHSSHATQAFGDGCFGENEGRFCEQFFHDGRR